MSDWIKKLGIPSFSFGNKAVIRKLPNKIPGCEGVMSEPIEFVRKIANKEILTKLLSPAERHLFSKAVFAYDALKAENEKLKNRFSRQAKKYWEGDLDSTLSGIKALKAENEALKAQCSKLMEKATTTPEYMANWEKILEEKSQLKYENELMRECLEAVSVLLRSTDIAREGIKQCLANLSKKEEK